MSKTLLVAGATGLIGGEVFRKAGDDGRFSRVIALVRRKLESDHPKLEQWVAADGDLLAGLRQERVDAVICCLGTTISNVGGDRKKFEHVDKELVVGLGRWAKDQGVAVFCVVSAIGADAGSSVFYNRVKGEMEDALKAMQLPTLHIFQPSILTGPRTEKRLGERIGIIAMSLFAPLLPARFKPMPHDVIAHAMLNATEQTVGGTHSTKEIFELADQKRATRG